MVKSALLCFALASTGVIGAALELGVNYALAADDCIDPKRLFNQAFRCEYTNRNLVHSALIPNSLMIGHHFSISAF
jgi:hypothetical protein